VGSQNSVSGAECKAERYAALDGVISSTQRDGNEAVSRDGRHGVLTVKAGVHGLNSAAKPRFQRGGTLAIDVL
jgi:hypothetical protein